MCQRSHANCYGYTNYCGHYCIIMEYCRQGALYDVLRYKDHNILPPQVVGWSRQIANGMQFLHSSIKTSNHQSTSCLPAKHLILCLLNICGLSQVLTQLVGASLSEPHHTIWPLEMVPWSMRETNAIKNGVDRRTCRPL